MNEVTRILGVDFGERRVGLAISDPLKLTAQPLATLEYKTEEELWSKLDGYWHNYTIERVVVGLPLHMHGEKSKLSQLVEKFAERAKIRYGVDVVLWDERLSSKVAEGTLRDMGKQPSRQKGKVDLISAIWILQGYLDGLNYQKRQE